MTWNAITRKTSNAGVGLACLSVLLALVAGQGTRWGFWHFSIGLAVVRWSVYGGLLAVVVSAAGLLLSLATGISRVRPRGFIGLILGCLLAGIPAYMLRAALHLPAIHDITTDTENPPAFAAVLPLRREASNPPGYGGRQIALQQKAAYPDIRTLVTTSSPESAFDKALMAARKLGWNIVEAGKSSGRIEATDSTLWFGFTDDIVIRIKGDGRGKTRIDIRSASRVGVGDLGTNAKRIRLFLTLMKE